MDGRKSNFKDNLKQLIMLECYLLKKKKMSQVLWYCDKILSIELAAPKSRSEYTTRAGRNIPPSTKSK